MTHVLSDNDARASVFGTSSYLQLGSRPVAAKTGTTNDYKDGWLIGYTPSLVVGVWGGNNNNTAMNRGAGGSTVAGPIWNAFMKRALEGTDVETFTAPVIAQTGKPALDGTIASTTLIVDKASGKLATKYTPDSYREEKTFAEYHSLLHYVDRSDPLGDAPKDPTKDGMYEAWEAGITTWLAAKVAETGVEIVNQAPPTEEDDLHVPANFPSVSIESPSKGDEFDDRAITIAVNADAPRGVSRIEFYMDGVYLGSDTSSPFKLSTTIPSSIDRGVHTIKAVAYDDIDNAGSDTVSIEVTSEGTAGAFELIDPGNGQTIERTSDTYTVVVSLENPSNYTDLMVYAEALESGSRELVGSNSNPSAPFITMDWTLPESGTWALSAQAKDGSETVVTAGILVEIIPAQASAETTEESTEGEAAEIYIPDSSLDIFGVGTTEE